MAKIQATHNDYMILGNVIEESISTLKKCGIKMVEGCHYDFHTQRAFGLAYTKQDKITINYSFFKGSITKNETHYLINTMIHEMLHIIAYHINKSGGHTGIWKILAEEVSKRTEYKIQRVGVVEKSALKATVDNPKYVIVCTKCGEKHYRYRRNKAVIMIENGSDNIWCAHCKGKLIIEA